MYIFYLFTYVLFVLKAIKILLLLLLFHVKLQTQHVRHTIPYRLYHHYFFEHIKDRLMTSIVNQY